LIFHPHHISPLSKIIPDEFEFGNPCIDFVSSVLSILGKSFLLWQAIPSSAKNRIKELIEGVLWMFAPLVLCVYFLIGYAYWRKMEDGIQEWMATGDEETESLAAEYQQIIDMVGENKAYFLFSFVVTVFWLPFEITILFRRWIRVEHD
jgi:hypothetical protein